MTEISGESTSMVRPTLGSRTAKEQNRDYIKSLLSDDKSPLKGAWSGSRDPF